jgi:hypothetical protein
MNDLDEVVTAAISLEGIESAAIFVRHPGSTDLELGAAAGVEGPPLDALVAAVRNPEHPITKTMDDAAPSYDVRPMNPGGPALRAHLPLDGHGVLAVTYESPLPPAAKATLEGLAGSAAAILRHSEG